MKYQNKTANECMQKEEENIASLGKTMHYSNSKSHDNEIVYTTVDQLGMRVKQAEGVEGGEQAECRNADLQKNFFHTMMSSSKALSRNLNHYFMYHHETLECIWSSSRPAVNQIKWSTIVKLQVKNDTNTSSNVPKRILKVHLFSTTLPESNNQQFQQEWNDKYTNLRKSNSLSPSVLKSALQKNIRRCRSKEALKCALSFLCKAKQNQQAPSLKENLIDLIRRLVVIIVEDACLIADTTWLCWHMMALTKDYPIDWTMIKRVMYIVYCIADIKYCDTLSSKKDNKELNIFDSEHIKLNTLPSNHASILFSLLCRSTFGGMACDIQMFKKSVIQWYGRLSQKEVTNVNFDGSTILLPYLNKSCLNSPIMYIDSLMNNPAKVQLQPTDIPHAAIDFHCSNQIQIIQKSTFLQKEIQNCVAQFCIEGKSLSLNQKDRDDLIKQTIWLFSSSTSKKVTIPESHEELRNCTEEINKNLWSIIQQTCTEYSLTYIRKRCYS